MKIDTELLTRFEAGLDPQQIERSRVPATLLGYGEISAIFKIEGDERTAYKRMPLFSDRSSAETYVSVYRHYCRLLRDAGLNLPEHDTAVVPVPGRPVVVYIAQEWLPAERFAHKLVHNLERDACYALMEQVARAVDGVWRFNAASTPEVELALDGQISNWVRTGGEKEAGLTYIDTSTPLFRLGGIEQMDPEPLLKSAPLFLRWILRWLFLDDVMNRYYDLRMVFIDIAANLYKEQCPDLIPGTIDVFNGYLDVEQKPLTEKAIEKYYREDRMIWMLFSAFRRVDRWLTTKLMRKRYEFILPGKIVR
ncbi:MAG: DUF6206 family protein [Deltaproteobacteria bacterium]|nr:DUF6206 family protein [Deltaproteobacteria bacterium]